jgi:hypothetical protein
MGPFGWIVIGTLLSSNNKQPISPRKKDYVGETDMVSFMGILVAVSMLALFCVVMFATTRNIVQDRRMGALTRQWSIYNEGHGAAVPHHPWRLKGTFSQKRLFSETTYYEFRDVVSPSKTLEVERTPENIRKFSGFLDRNFYWNYRRDRGSAYSILPNEGAVDLVIPVEKDPR